MYDTFAENTNFGEINIIESIAGAVLSSVQSVYGLLVNINMKLYIFLPFACVLGMPTVAQAPANYDDLEIEP
jgi:hypothetical protein